MKKRFLLSVMLGAFALSGVAQDDMYFVPSKRSSERSVRPVGVPSGTYYSGSTRSIDDYNRRWASSYEVLPTDTGDIISFAPIEGVYPDSLGDFALTQRMTRFDGYEPSTAYWEGYAQGRRDYIGWHSPWYYSSFYPWYDPWYYDIWYWDRWYWDPWYYHGYYSYYYYPYYSWGWGGGYIGYHNRNTQNHGRIAGASPSTYTLGRGSGFGGSRRGSFGGTRAGSYGSTGSGAFGGSRTGSIGGTRSSGSYGNTGSGSFGGSRSSGSFGGSRTTRPVSGSSNSTPTYSGSSSSSSSSSSGSFGGSRSSGGGGGSFGGSRSGGGGGGGGGGGRSGGGGFGGSRR